MSILAEARALFDEWLAIVAITVDSAIGRYARGPHIVLEAESDGLLTAKLKSTQKGEALSDVSFRNSDGQPSPSLPEDWQAAFRGSRVETELAPDQVLFRTLDFPKQAEDFLDGMIRTQIDRLMPWSADAAVFGWSTPLATPQGRIELTLAAASKQEVEPLVRLAATLNAQSLAAFAAPPGASKITGKIKVLDQPLRSGSGRMMDTPARAASCAAVGRRCGYDYAAGRCLSRRQLRFRTARVVQPYFAEAAPRYVLVQKGIRRTVSSPSANRPVLRAPSCWKRCRKLFRTAPMSPSFGSMATRFRWSA
jgi:hypothetical protein